jgi:hypothetical protein
LDRGGMRRRRGRISGRERRIRRGRYRKRGWKE